MCASMSGHGYNLNMQKPTTIPTLDCFIIPTQMNSPAFPTTKQYRFEAGIISLLPDQSWLHRPTPSRTFGGGYALVSGWQSPLGGLECNTRVQHIDLCDKIMKVKATAGIAQRKGILLIRANSACHRTVCHRTPQEERREQRICFWDEQVLHFNC